MAEPCDARFPPARDPFPATGAADSPVADRALGSRNTNTKTKKLRIAIATDGFALRADEALVVA
jgi:hypothetical protein